jgi:Ca-activated chloride channel family protein
VSGLQWTAIWDALIFAWDNFNESEREKVIILLTDWTANAGVDPNIAVSFLNEKYNWDNKVKIYTIWIWKDEETFISIKNVMWFSQKIAIEWVDEETLKQIAKLSNWKYFRAENKESLWNIFDNIAELEKTDIEINSITDIKSISKYLVYILIFIFTIFMWYKIRKKI